VELPAPAVVAFPSGSTISLADWTLSEFGADYYGSVYSQLGGWITELKQGVPEGGRSRIVHADLPGREPIADQDVGVGVSSHGGHRMYMTLRWQSGYDPAADQRINPA